MQTHHFVGDKPVESFKPEDIKKIDDDTLTEREIKRDLTKEPGANRRAGVASRNPADFDVRAEGGHGDPKPVKEPLI